MENMSFCTRDLSEQHIIPNQMSQMLLERQFCTEYKVATFQYLMLNSSYVPKLSATVCGGCNSFHVRVQRNTVLYFLEVENIGKKCLNLSCVFLLDFSVHTEAHSSH